jgi:hypothetical protein
MTISARLPLLVFYLMIVGCSAKPLDYCKLLTLQEVGRLHENTVSAKMEQWYQSTDHPTWYCTWKDHTEKNLLSLSISLKGPTSASTFLSTFSGGSPVVDVSGVGSDAAAMFYKGDGGLDRVTLVARKSGWSLDIRSAIVGDETGESFKALKELANQAFVRLESDPSFSRLAKK